jgi:hypothetical protein
VAPSERTQRFLEKWYAQMTERTQPFLEPGEEIQAIFPAQVGLNPGGGMFSGAFSVANRKIIIAATDRNVVVLNARHRKTPTGVASRLPRQTRLGPATTRPMQRAFARLSGLPDPTWINAVYRYAVDAADGVTEPPSGHHDGS